MSDQLVHWLTMGLYVAIAVLAFTPLHALRVEGVLLTVLVLLGLHVALRLMFAIGAPETPGAPGVPPKDVSVANHLPSPH